METIYFGAGCFWCSEAAFSRVRGVSSVVSGYIGGTVADPTYEEVSTGRTGHAEVVQVVYDPSIITLRDLLAVFFTIHNPTTLNSQGYDVGTQYRSLIAYTSDEQKRSIDAYIKSLAAEHTFQDPIVTEVVKASAFYPADSSHYRYYDLNKESGYCQVVIDPKLAKLRKSFAHLLK